MAGQVDQGALREHAERLYAGSPDDFVAVRTLAVKALREAGDRPTAAAVGALRRPTVAAWVVNRLVRERPEVVEELLELGASLRAAQSSLDADTLRELSQQRRRLVSAVGREAGVLASEAGTPLASAAGRQVEDTLQAAVVDADLAEVVRSGLLVQPLSSTGVESLADVQAIPGAPRLTVLPGSHQAEEAQETGGVQETKAAQETEAAQATREEAARAEREAREREEARARERTRLQRERRSERRDLEKAEASVSRLARDVADLRQRLEAAEATLSEAEQRRNAVRTRIDALDEALGDLSRIGADG